VTNEEIKVLTETEARSKSNTKRLDKLEERQDNFDKLVTSVATMATKQESMESDIGEIKTDVKTLAGVPARRWEAAVDKVIMGIVAALLAYVAAKIGLGG